MRYLTPTWIPNACCGRCGHEMRGSTCSDVTKLTPHGWKQHLMADVEAERERLLASVL